MTKRPKVPLTAQNEVLVKSRRRCALCWNLSFQIERVKGQIAHIDRNRRNNDPANLVWLCLPHHDEYDTRTSQSKGLTESEVRVYRDNLYKTLDDIQKRSPWELGQLMQQRSRTRLRRSRSASREVDLQIFDRRLAVYRVVRAFISRVITDANPTRELLTDFARETDEVLFLFDSDMTQYVSDLYRKALQLRLIHNRIDTHQNSKSHIDIAELADKDAEILLWFTQEIVGARSRFARFLTLSR